MSPYPSPFQCPLCLTDHETEGKYLAHTQGRKHQTTLAQREAGEQKKGKAGTDSVTGLPPKGLSKMEYRFLGRSGLQVSAIALGGWLTFGGHLHNGMVPFCFISGPEI
jgi:hypothetical protein